MIMIILMFCIGAAIGAVLPCKANCRSRCGCALICGIGYATVTYQFGMTMHCVHMLILFALLIAAAFFDIDKSEIPDSIHIAAVIIFLVFLPLEGNILFTVLHGILGAVVIGGGIILLSYCADHMTGQETLGGGDIKLFAVLGLHFGIVRGIFAVAFSCIIGLIFCVVKHIKKGSPFPFAPSIALGAFVTATAGEYLINLYPCVLGWDVI